MERVPTYNLEIIKETIRSGHGYFTTASAKCGAGSAGLSDEDIPRAVLDLCPADFHKTMEAELRPGFWQDVYRKEYRGRVLYIKVQITDRPGVISFKPWGSDL
jgi:hypothetical protein